MDTPDEHVKKVDNDDADHDLHSRYLGRPGAPAQSYNAWSDPAQQVSQPSQRSFAPTNVPTPCPQPFAPTNVPSPFPHSYRPILPKPSPPSFAPSNVPAPSPPQAQIQPEVSQTGQKLFAPTNNSGSVPDAYTAKYPQPGWDARQPYYQPVRMVEKFSPTSPHHSTAQSVQSQIPRGFQGYVSPQSGGSQLGQVHGASNGRTSSYQGLRLPQTRAFPASAGHSSDATRATTRYTGFFANGDPFPRTRAYLALTGYNFDAITPNNTKSMVGKYALASQDQASATNVAVKDRQHLMDAQLMPPPKSTQPLRNSQPVQPTQGPRMQQWRTDNLQHAQGSSQIQSDKSNQDLRMQEEKSRHGKEVRRNTIAAGTTVSQTPAVKPDPKSKRRSVHDMPGVVPLSKEKRQKLNSGPLISELFKPSNPPSASSEPCKPRFSSAISDLWGPVFSRQGPPPKSRKPKLSSPISEVVAPVDSPSTPPQPRRPYTPTSNTSTRDPPSTPPQPHTPTSNALNPSSRSPPPAPRKIRKPTSIARKLPIKNPLDLGPTPSVQTSPDELSQPIVDNYPDYEWSVYHYSMLPLSGYDYAESWVQALLEVNPAADYPARHVAHVSQGFIENGGPLSIIMLCNATNPFEYEPVPDATTTIGVYGLHWNRHEEIHWTTVAKDVRWLLLGSLQAGYIKLEHRWASDDPNASERRFHRAYWLAANRRDLGGLLNRMPSTATQPDLIEDKSAEDPDKDFRIDKEDLTNEWDATAEQSESAWQQVSEEVELLGEDFDTNGQNFQHMVVSNTEDF